MEIIVLILGTLLIYQVVAKVFGLPALSLKFHERTEAPTALSHFDILKLMICLGNPDFEGVCYGFTLNWAIAIALGEEAFFYQQLELIRSYRHNVPGLLEHIHYINQVGYPQNQKEQCAQTIPQLAHRICLAQRPDYYRDFYGKLLWQPDINFILDTLFRTKVQQVYYRTHTFASRQEAMRYFDKLIELGIDNRIAVVICNVDHAMGFVRKNDRWHFLNINTLYRQSNSKPYMEFTTPQLVNELYKQSTHSHLSRRLTLSTDFIALANRRLDHVFRPLENLYPVFSRSAGASYKNKIAFFAMAAWQGDMVTVKKCIQAEWSIFSTVESQSSPIITAINLGRREVVKAMISTVPHRINAKSKNLSTLLHNACDTGHSGIVKDLLAIKGIKIDAQDNRGMTPLMWACISKLTTKEDSLFDILLQHGASLTLTDNQGQTALDCAIAHNHQLAIDKIRSELVAARDRSITPASSNSIFSWFQATAEQSNSGLRSTGSRPNKHALS